MHVLTSNVKPEQLSSFVSYSNLKLTAPTVLFSAITDVAVVIANIQQFNFLFQTQYKVPLTVHDLHQDGRKRKVCTGDSFEINQAQLMLQLLNKRQSWGTSL